jgi:hypothetical protein
VFLFNSFREGVNVRVAKLRRRLEIGYRSWVAIQGIIKILFIAAAHGSDPINWLYQKDFNPKSSAYSNEMRQTRR